MLPCFFGAKHCRHNIGQMKKNRRLLRFQCQDASQRCRFPRMSALHDGADYDACRCDCAFCNAFMVNKPKLESVIAMLVTQSVMHGFPYNICNGKLADITIISSAAMHRPRAWDMKPLPAIRSIVRPIGWRIASNRNGLTFGI